MLKYGISDIRLFSKTTGASGAVPMKVSLKWLKDYVDVEIPAQELADRLTIGGS